METAIVPSVVVIEIIILLSVPRRQLFEEEEEVIVVIIFEEEEVRMEILFVVKEISIEEEAKPYQTMHKRLKFHL